MTRNARSPISPYEAERIAIAELGRLGVRAASPTRWKRKRSKDGVDLGYARPWKRHGPKRDGKHRSHTCSRTGGGSSKRGGN